MLILPLLISMIAVQVEYMYTYESPTARPMHCKLHHVTHRPVQSLLTSPMANHSYYLAWHLHAYTVDYAPQIMKSSSLHAALTPLWQ